MWWCDGLVKTEEAHQDFREQQRVKILHGALYVFARKGWSATMTDIADQVGISQGLAYRYFAGKEAVFASLIARAQDLRLVDDVLQGAGSPKHRLRELLSMLLVPGSLEMEFYQFSIQIARDESAPPPLRLVLEDLATKFREGLRRIIAEGQVAGEFVAGDPTQLATALFAMVNGLTMLGLRGNPQVMTHFPDADIVLRILIHK